MTPYQMVINNVARFIGGQNPETDPKVVTAFDASIILGVAFAKSPVEVLMDLVKQ